MVGSRPAVSVRGLTKSYGQGNSQVVALHGVDLDIEAGHFVAVVGRSGSGKSTLLHLVAGLDTPTSGTIAIDGEIISTMNDDQLTRLRRRRVGLVFQAFNLLEVLTAEENAALPLMIDGVGEQEAHDRARVALEKVGLGHRRHHLPKEMSGGEQQRVAIARALVVEPKLLLADEPTGNLDSHNSEQVMELLQALMAERKQTILMVTHDETQASMADRIIEFRDGQVVA